MAPVVAAYRRAYSCVGGPKVWVTLLYALSRPAPYTDAGPTAYIVRRCRNDQGAGAGRADDRVVQRRVVPRSAEAQVDNPGPRARLHRPPHSVVGRQARGVQNALSDVIGFTEASGAESADWADAYRPVHTAHAEPVVA